ncbi:MAG: UDP-N-acetylmuramate dehydrogenase [Patescibacteria group bacterium]
MFSDGNLTTNFPMKTAQNNNITVNPTIKSAEKPIFRTEDLSLHLTTGIGPVVEFFFLPKSKEEIQQAIEFIRNQDLDYYILGGGSNTIIDDQLDSNKAVICLKEYKGIKPLEDFNILVRAGTPLQQVVDYALEHELSGLTGLNRVPGSLGGAVLGNAGAYGTEIRQTVLSVTCLDIRDLSIKTFSNEQSTFSYRDSYYKQNPYYIILDIVLSLTKSANPEVDSKRYHEIASIRDEVYPPGFRSPGSVFKNFPTETVSDDTLALMDPQWIKHGKLSVGAILESVGSKGFNVEGVRMRLIHGNIMEIFADADFDNVEELVKTLQLRVKEKYNLEIEPEIRLVKEFRKL